MIKRRRSTPGLSQEQPESPSHSLLDEPEPEDLVHRLSVLSALKRQR